RCRCPAPICSHAPCGSSVSPNRSIPRAKTSPPISCTSCVRNSREELADLLDGGAALVQFDEPVLSEVVFSGAKSKRSFMCGALSESLGPAHELGFAKDLMNAVVDGFDRDRIAVHVCRGNW